MMRLHATQLVAVLAVVTLGACGVEGGSEEGRIYAAVIEAALDRGDFFLHPGESIPLPDAPLYVSPSIQHQTERAFRNVPMSRDIKPVIREHFLGVRFVEPKGQRAIRVQLGTIAALGDVRRQVQVRVFNGVLGRGHVGKYLLDRRGLQWRVVRAMHAGYIIE